MTVQSRPQEVTHARPAARPSPEGDDAARDGSSWPLFAWVPGSADTGPVPIGRLGGAVGPCGLDGEALLEALAASGRLADDGDQEAVLADELAAAADGRMGPADPARIAAVAVEHMDSGPAQAAWLEVAAAAAGRLDEDALAGMMIASRQLASRAVAAELSAAAQITARAAAADPSRSDGSAAPAATPAITHAVTGPAVTDHPAAGWSAGSP